VSRQVEEIRESERRVVHDPDAVDTRHDSEVLGEEVVTHGDPWHAARGVVRSIQMLIGVVVLALESLLAFRFVFLLTGANPNNGFVDFIYDSTGWLVDPFEGIASTSDTGDGVFDPATLIAMAVVMVVGVLVVLALSALTAYSGTGSRVTTRTSSRHGHASHEG
jgi:hypothetical protein